MQELMLVKGGMLLNLLCQGLDPDGCSNVVMRWFIIYLRCYIFAIGLDG
jgi:hypothetical protein